MHFRNLAELLRIQATRLGPAVALRRKRHGLYHDITWAEYYQAARAIAAALIDVGIRTGDRVGLVAENRMEWLVADMGLLLAGAVNVPPHAPLTASQIQFQLEDAEVSWLFVSSRQQLEKIRRVRAKLPRLRGVVVLDANVADDDCLSWRAFVQRGRDRLPTLEVELRKREQALGAKDLATIMYTSGTTGNPKGVMLTHGNLLSNACAVNEACSRPAGSLLLSWLPYSHIYARTVDHYLSIVAGVTMALAESAETVVENLGEIEPTHMSSVPRLYEKVLNAVASDDPAETGKRLRKVFGPRVHWLSSGGAPLPLSVARAYLDAGVIVLQGYGLTECAPVISFNAPDQYKLETVGRAIPGVEVRIGPDGEVLTRGPHVMPGYWNNPQASADAVRDGWLHTGDLGCLDEDGFLRITGRKKELLVLSNGKKIVPPLIEGLILADSCVDQVVVYGEGKNFLSALVVPHWANLRKELQAANIAAELQENESLARDEQITAWMQKRIDTALAEVSGPERVKKIVLLPRPFSVEAEELTVSLKLRRNVIFEHYGNSLDALYQDK